MNIDFQSVSKRFAYEWIFKDVDYHIESGASVGIVGPNGSGKSTLLRILLGTLDPSKGKMLYTQDSKEISVGEVYKNFSFSAPYMDIPSNYNLKEILKFHFSFRNPLSGIEKQELIDIAYLQKSKNKEFRQFSSGMQQRFKLALALCTDSPVIVLDEPTTNLDEDAKAWFRQLISDYRGDRTLIIASNEKEDLELCSEQLSILNFK